MTMSARPKGKPNAPKSSFCTPGFCVLICTATTMLRPKPVVLSPQCQSLQPSILSSVLACLLGVGVLMLGASHLEPLHCIAGHELVRKLPEAEGSLLLPGELLHQWRSSEHNQMTGRHRLGCPARRSSTCARSTAQGHLRLHGKIVVKSAKSLWTGCPRLPDCIIWRCIRLNLHKMPKSKRCQSNIKGLRVYGSPWHHSLLTSILDL